MQKIRFLYQCVNAISKRQVFWKRDKNIEEKKSSKVLQIISSQNKSEGIQSDKIEQIEDNVWLVTSDTDTKIKYSVEKVDIICSNCALSCNQCNIYVHTFRCSCIHNVIYLKCLQTHTCNCKVKYFKSIIKR